DPAVPFDCSSSCCIMPSAMSSTVTAGPAASLRGTVVQEDIPPARLISDADKKMDLANIAFLSLNGDGSTRVPSGATAAAMDCAAVHWLPDVPFWDARPADVRPYACRPRV